MIFYVRSRDLVFCALSDNVQLAFKFVFIKISRTTNEELLDVGLRSTRNPPNGRTVHRRITPAEDHQAFFADDPFQNPLALESRLLVDWEKNHSDGIFSRLGKLEPKDSAFADEELVRYLDQNAGAVSGLRI